ncbi:MarR family winged helix-turn-helix transcriptional regulator [Sneathiella aquimaris]|uniref:MarR family winged helix-turn-helix transcriptional regulator n=1 Tax=Sneathiella aquimaris TaxID=2599305 RepID=UPI001CA4B060|nr:MarR family transcriptional regulator [Sneathiella aquimaris]
MNEETVQVWIRLVRAHEQALSTIETALKKAGFPPLAWYDCLWELEQAGEAGLRPSALNDALLLPQYGVSRILDRLEKAGYIRRTPCEEDRRAQQLFLTPAGQKTRIAMWPIYQEALEQAVGRRLSLDQQRKIASLLKPLTD